jgi:hypothetical protein
MKFGHSWYLLALSGLGVIGAVIAVTRIGDFGTLAVFSAIALGLGSIVLAILAIRQLRSRSDR